MKNSKKSEGIAMPTEVPRGDRGTRKRECVGEMVEEICQWKRFPHIDAAFLRPHQLFLGQQVKSSCLSEPEASISLVVRCA